MGTDCLRGNMAGNYYRVEDIERMGFVASLVPAFSTVLDIGAYDDTFKKILEGHGHKVVALDLKPKGGEVVQGDVTRLPFADDSFDCVTAMEVLEHLTNRQLLAAIPQIKRVSRHTVIISVPDDEVPLGEGHLQHFTGVALRVMFGGYDAELHKVGKRQKYHGLQKWLAKIDTRLLHLVSRVWGIRRREGATWLVARFTKC